MNKNLILSGLKKQSSDTAGIDSTSFEPKFCHFKPWNLPLVKKGSPDGTYFQGNA